MNQKEINKLVAIAKTFRGYDDAPKREFHRLAQKYLNELARIMELTPGEFEVRSNKAGVACLGEVILHTRNLYVHIGGSMASERFYYRAVKHMKDFTGGANAWMDYDRLTDQNAVAEHFTKYLDSHRYEWAA